MEKKIRNLIDIRDLSTKEIDDLIEVANDIIDHKEKYSHKCDGKILATLFFEPSTRTRLSFESAMLRLGGKVLGFSEASSSSTAKGETLSDTVCVVSGYADIIAMRHPKEGAPMVALKKSMVPIINAGDGGHNHPTQTLTDLLTIKREKKRLNNLTIGLCGDLKFGRTIHYMLEYMNELDILYMTRVQKERFFNEEDYLRLKDYYILDENKLKNAKKDLCIMHPLPRVNEISTDIDDDNRAKYFIQAYNGVYIRMALILKLLEVK